MDSTTPRILRVITRLNIGGPAIQAITLANTSKNHLLLYGRLDSGEGDMRDIIALTGSSSYLPHLVRPIHPWHDLLACAALFKTIRRFRPDIIHTHTAKAGLIARVAAVAAKLLCKQNCTLIHTYHGHVFRGYFGRLKTAFFIHIEKLLATQSDCLISISDKLRDELSCDYRIAPAEKFRVVPLGFELKPFQHGNAAAIRREFNIASETKLCLAVGRLVPIKNQKLLLEAMAQLAQSNIDVRLLIVGDGVLRAELEKRARTLHLEKQLIFCGWRRDMPDLYAAADLNILTSINEGTPVAIIEAAAAGTCSLANDVGGVSDIIRDGKTGVVLDQKATASEFATAIEALLCDDQRRHSLGNAAREEAQEHFSFERLRHNLQRIYNEL